jgi:transglutaminase-like putative cysteine protease
MSEVSIGTLRRAGVFMRTLVIATVVIYTVNVLSPGAQVVAAVARDGLGRPTFTRIEDPHGRTLSQVSSHLRRLEAVSGARRGKASELDTERAELQRLGEELNKQNVDVLAYFDSVDSQIKKSGLPAEIAKRHDEAVAKFKAESAYVQTELAAVTASGRNTPAPDRIRRLRDHLSGLPSGNLHRPLDPAKLPFRTSDRKVRAPKLRPEEFSSVLPRTKIASLRLAPLNGALLTVPADIPTDYLLPTEDVQITQPIKDLAAQLSNSPVSIYNWVHNNIDYLPTFGSIQGSDLTLQAKRGNAFDIASLLIALLRAAGIPARYVYGTVEVPADRAMNWVADVSTPSVAQDLIGQGGVPNVAVTDAGAIKALRVEHVWVEAYLDFQPSRGAKNIRPNTWVALDASFKQHDRTAPTFNIESLGLNAAGVAQDVANAAVGDGTTTGMTQLVPGYAQARFQEFATSIQNYMSANGAGANLTLNDVLGGFSIHQESPPVLPASLPYRLVAVGSRFAALPDSLRVTASLALYSDATALGSDTPALTYSISLPALRNRRLGATYAPASASDAQLIQSAISAGSSALPAYLINVAPTLRVDGDTVLTGPAATLGTHQLWTVSISGPATQYAVNQSFDVTAGDELVFSINGAGLDQDQLLQREAQVTEVSAAENLFDVALLYWSEHDLFDNLYARVYKVSTTRLPSFGLFSSPLSVAYAFGIPRTAYYQNRRMDIKNSLVAVAASDAQTRFNYATRIGYQGSQLEGAAFEQTFRRLPGTAISAAELLLEAASLQIPIFSIDSSNLATALPQLSVDAAVEADIQNAVAAGKTVTIPQSSPRNSVYGYVIQDPTTGAAAYLLDGGFAGGEEQPCHRALEPVVVAIAAIILTLVVFAILSIVLGPEIIPIGKPVLEAVMAGVGATALVFPATTQAATADDCCEPVPRCPHRGEDQFHNVCADGLPPNEFPGCDAVVNGKSFDAISGGKSILWEMKTYNLANQSKFFISMNIQADASEIREESALAHRCKFRFNLALGDAGVVVLLQNLGVTSPGVVDQIIVDERCKQPPK